MFDIGWSELVLIAIISIVLLKPKDIPEILKQLRSFMATCTKLKNDFIAAINNIEDECKIKDTTEDIKIDFASFTKEFLEPIEKNKKTIPEKKIQKKSSNE